MGSDANSIVLWTPKCYGIGRAWDCQIVVHDDFILRLWFCLFRNWLCHKQWNKGVGFFFFSWTNGLINLSWNKTTSGIFGDQWRMNLFIPYCSLIATSEGQDISGTANTFITNIYPCITRVLSMKLPELRRLHKRLIELYFTSALVLLSCRSLCKLCTSCVSLKDSSRVSEK